MSGTRVAVDVQLAAGTATGIGEYARGLVAALDTYAPEFETIALRWSRFDPWRFDRRVLWDQVALPLRAAAARVRLLHCTSGTMPALAPVPLVVTVHDVAWLRVQAHARPYARADFGAFSLARYARARAILVDSAFSRDELLSVAPLDPSLVRVAYPGDAADIATIVRARDADDAPFVLAVGTVEPRKNLASLVRALPALPGVRLVSVGPPTPYAARCAALASELGVAGRFALRGYVARAELRDLYARATVAAVPSHYEGFGYGAAQALCAGVPLVASNASSLPEIVAGEAPLVAPDDLAGWTDALRAIVADPAAANARAAAARARSVARFGWSATVRVVAAAYARALR